MDDVLVIDDVGTRQFQVGKNAQPFEVDLILCMDRIAAINTEHGDSKEGPVPHYIALVKELSGGGPCSGKQALDFCKMVVDQVGALEKKSEPTPSSAGSTDLTASTSPPGKSTSCTDGSTASPPSSASTIPSTPAP